MTNKFGDPIPHRRGCEPRTADIIEGATPFYIAGISIGVSALFFFIVEEATGYSMTWPAVTAFVAALVIAAICTKRGGGR